MINIIPELKALADIFNKNQHLLYIVGGYIRDSLLDIKNFDIDICSDLKIEEVENLLKNTNFKIVTNNKQFGTAKIFIDNINFEYCTFRKDYYNSSGKHCPKKIEFVKTLFEDAKRRDFTINAMYFDISNNILIDPFNAQNDLTNRLIKAVPPAHSILSNDGERLLRMAKFKAKLDFKIEGQTFKYAIQYSNNLKDLNQNTIQKFIKSINNFSNKQKKDIKEILELLGAYNIANSIMI